MHDTHTEQNRAVLGHEDDEELEVTNEDPHWGAPPWFRNQEPENGPSEDEQRIVEVIEDRGAHEIHPGGPGVGGD